MKISSKNKNPIDFSLAIGSEVFQTRRGNSGFLFFFGNSPDLAKIEAERVAARLLPFLKYDSMITRQVAWFKSDNSLNKTYKTYKSYMSYADDSILNVLSNVQNVLGGTVKIAEIIGLVQSIGDLENELIQSLPETSDHKINLAISNYSSGKIYSKLILINLKKQLKTKNISCRFVLAKELDILSTAEIFHNHLDIWSNVEFNIISVGSEFLIARTVSVQNPNDWSKRDFGIPAPDAHSGMLPPKLARMMLNLRIRDIGKKRDTREIIYDPFCGNGRVILEAAFLGLDFIGSDIDPVKVESTKKNLRWLRDQYQLKFTNEEIEKKVFVADAQKLNNELRIMNYGQNSIHDSSFMIHNSELHIVTEPDLGPALHYLPSTSQAETIANNLLNLYVKSIENLITTTACGVFVIPAWKTQDGHIIRLSKKILDKLNDSRYHLNKLGEYARPNSFIIREMYQINTNEH